MAASPALDEHLRHYGFKLLDVVPTIYGQKKHSINSDCDRRDGCATWDHHKARLEHPRISTKVPRPGDAPRGSTKNAISKQHSSGSPERCDSGHQKWLCCEFGGSYYTGCRRTRAGHAAPGPDVPGHPAPQPRHGHSAHPSQIRGRAAEIPGTRACVPGLRPVRLQVCGQFVASCIRGLGEKSGCRAGCGARAWRPCAPQPACHRIELWFCGRGVRRAAEPVAEPAG